MASVELPDEIWLQVLRGADISALSLCRLSQSCRQLRAVASADELWRRLYAIDFPDHSQLRGGLSWKRKYAIAHVERIPRGAWAVAVWGHYELMSSRLTVRWSLELSLPAAVLLTEICDLLLEHAPLAAAGYGITDKTIKSGLEFSRTNPVVVDAIARFGCQQRTFSSFDDRRGDDLGGSRRSPAGRAPTTVPGRNGRRLVEGESRKRRLDDYIEPAVRAYPVLGYSEEFPNDEVELHLAAVPEIVADFANFRKNGWGRLGEEFTCDWSAAEIRHRLETQTMLAALPTPADAEAVAALWRRHEEFVERLAIARRVYTERFKEAQDSGERADGFIPEHFADNAFRMPPKLLPEVSAVLARVGHPFCDN